MSLCVQSFKLNVLRIGKKVTILVCSSGSQGCAGCRSPPSLTPSAPFDVEIHEMEMCNVLKTQEDSKAKKNLSETAMEEGHPEEDEEDEVEEEGTKTQDGNQEMGREEPSVEDGAHAQPHETDMTH